MTENYTRSALAAFRQQQQQQHTDVVDDLAAHGTLSVSLQRPFDQTPIVSRASGAKPVKLDSRCTVFGEDLEHLNER